MNNFSTKKRIFHKKRFYEYSFRFMLFRYNRAWKNLRDAERFLRRQKKPFSTEFLSLRTAIQKRSISGKEALERSLALKRQAKRQRSLPRRWAEGVVGLVIALLFAVLIRTVWFELYEIPTGSMRPTYQEGDRLIATKSSYGINIPLLPTHAYFDNALLSRDEVVIFSLDNMDARDPDGIYFWLFKGKKMLIKRLIAKGGDTIYFYGGRVWMLDGAGELRSPTSPIEHVAYITYEGHDGKQSGVQPTTSTFLGLHNFAQVKLVGHSLQIAHYPGPERPLVIGKHSFARPYVSEILLSESQLQTIAQHLSTARFIVEKERAQRTDIVGHSIPLFGVPDGTYQFIDGEAQEIDFAGIVHTLPKDHPLYSPKLLQLLFNEGFEFAGLYSPASPFFPQRFVYFRNGQLMLANVPLLTAAESAAFQRNEENRASPNYHPFLDEGDPTKERIAAHGLTIPAHSYYVLGDNYAMSADSRDFGFVPDGNIRGAPAFIFWPPGSRFGIPQVGVAWFTLPHLLLWMLLALATAIVWRTYYRIPK